MDPSHSLKERIALLILPRLFYWLVRVIALSCRKHISGAGHIQALRSQNKNWIYAMWHNNIAVALWLLHGQRVPFLVSVSTDGELIARTALASGNSAVRGSSSQGGSRALLQMSRILRRGSNAGITPDGPRGPRYRLQSGAVQLARITGAPLVAVHTECSRQWVFTRSWDQQKIPKPFSTIYVRYSEPFFVKKHAGTNELESSRQDFEKLMLENVQAVKLQLEQNSAHNKSP